MNTSIRNITDEVHTLYWEHDLNCARTTLRVLCNLNSVSLHPQVFHAALGMHGAGGFRAQCGLVEGALMFFGIYHTLIGRNASEVAAFCKEYAYRFIERFGSLSCADLRPCGLNPEDPPHLCEELTVHCISFANEFLQANTKLGNT